MPESVKDAFQIASTLKSAVSGMIASGATMFIFFSRFQTKRGCTKSHSDYEILQESRRQTAAADLKIVVAQQVAIHDAVERIEKLVNKIAGDLYEPRTIRTRSSDSR